MAREEELTPQQRLDAIAEIFARGVHRWLIKQEVEAAAKPAERNDNAPAEAAQPS